MGALPSTPPTEGEAMVVRRQPEELPRKDAQDRVFGERKRSTVTATQLRGVSMEDDREDVVSEPSVKGMAEPAEGLAAAKRAHEARIADFERDNEEWFSKQKACTVPAGHLGADREACRCSAARHRRTHQLQGVFGRFRGVR